VDDDHSKTLETVGAAAARSAHHIRPGHRKRSESLSGCLEARPVQSVRFSYLPERMARNGPRTHEDDEMSTTALDQAFAAATPSSELPVDEPKGGGGLLPAGEYQGVVVAAEVRKGFRPWVDQELSLRLQVDGGEYAGRTTFCDIEIAPLSGRDGGISEGKLKYVKWQITDVLGYDGTLSELGTHAERFIGSRVSFDQRVTLAAKINPNTGTPYENREVTLKAHLGHAAPGEVSGPTPDTSDFYPVNTPSAEDDDIPF
jgi:hypothetical protein